ncbi:MAG: hypothetical protein LKI25_08585 [Atopobiaceae bacterium]|jgi:bifunctional DNA-binding transcriptional regulator/antitoxin component of YhaV-PrlF toxin-antitoxin module|nr:hypothetical protein [Atopobiaceae bacterium]MCI2174242.1 hypothetical protein [Atopobiaceae bacterium]MCI2206883.1 hypothetical protein [Atopobiaceae bacterium]
MPQLNKGGKYVFGISLIGDDGSLVIPPEAADEYHIELDDTVIIFSGSRSTGGFCVTRPGLLRPSALGHILDELPGVEGRTVPAGELVRYKGRRYAWLPVGGQATLAIPARTMADLEIAPGTRLLCIRSSDIAFTMGAKGPLWERARSYAGEIPSF